MTDLIRLERGISGEDLLRLNGKEKRRWVHSFRVGRPPKYTDAERAARRKEVAAARYAKWKAKQDPEKLRADWRARQARRKARKAAA